MKTIYLVRHAKSSWKDPSLADFDRPLNKRGKNDLVIMGELMNQKKIKLELILSSPAKRAKKTAIGIIKKLGFKENKIVFKDDIYEASDRILLNIIKKTDERIKSVMLFGHNPGLTQLNNLISNHYIDNIPTCGIVALTSEKDWKNAGNSSFNFLFFEFPKKVKEK